MASWLARYQWPWLRWDLLAGLTTAAVVVHQAVAYLSLAGMPVQVGLYVALAPMLVYAPLGTSRPLSVSSTSTISILTASALAEAGAAADPGRALLATQLTRPVQPGGPAGDAYGLFWVMPAPGIWREWRQRTFRLAVG